MPSFYQAGLHKRANPLKGLITGMHKLMRIHNFIDSRQKLALYVSYPDTISTNS